MNFIFLGTGTSTGVPQIGCECSVCVSGNRKDKRLRASVLISEGDTRILIDCGPDLRQQLLQNNINKVTGILISHEHYDHIGGLDDVRPLGHTSIYAEHRVLDAIKRAMPYCFVENKYPGVPIINLSEIGEEPFFIEGTLIQPIRVMHADLPILGYRIGNFAYLTDVKTIDEKSINLLEDLDVLVINALRHKTHISHLSLKEALEIAGKIGAGKTYFTHMSHDMGLHDAVNKLLPANVELAYDGLSINI